MIISASRRTDIPAFYAKWFMNRIRAGFCTTVNPFNAKQVSTKLDMGKSCVRLKKIDQIPYRLIGDLATKMTPQQWIEHYEGVIKR